MTKSRSIRFTKGSRWLRATLIECAHAAARTKDSYLSEHSRQVTRRRGAKKAAVAVAHEILVAVWRLLSTGEFYDDPGAEALRAGNAERSRRRALRQLEALGYRVPLEPAKAA
jgi:transposase